MSHISFFSSGCWYKPMASWLRWVTESLERWFQLLMSAETFHSPLASMCSTKPVSEHWHTRFYIAVLYLQFFLLGFSQSQSHADRVVNLTWPLDFYCFGELELGPGPALAKSWPQMCCPGTWAENTAIVEPQSWLTARSVVLFIPDFSKIQKKWRPYKRLFKAHARDFCCIVENKMTSSQ